MLKKFLTLLCGVTIVAGVLIVIGVAGSHDINSTNLMTTVIRGLFGFAVSAIGFIGLVVTDPDFFNETY